MPGFPSVNEGSCLLDGCFLPTLCARRSHAQPSPAALTPGISKLAFVAQSSTENSDRDQMLLRRQAGGPMKLQSMSESCPPEQQCDPTPYNCSCLCRLQAASEHRPAPLNLTTCSPGPGLGCEIHPDQQEPCSPLETTNLD